VPQGELHVKMSVVLGIDIGGTNTSFGFVDRSGTIIAETSMATKSDDAVENFVSRLYNELEKSRIALPSDHCLCGIGIGAPNANYYRGTIEQAVHLNWGETVHLVELMRHYYNMPIALTNDANVAAIGEIVFGNARGMKNFMVITLGTGLGSGIVVDGRLLYGSRGFARELGHTVVDPEGRQCGCGKKGCLETYASATGLVKTALLLTAERDDPSTLRTMHAEAVTSK